MLLSYLIITTKNMLNWTVYLQTNYEEMGIKSLLIATIIALSGVVVYLYKSKETALKDKDDKILEVIKNHQVDLKEANDDMRSLIDKYNQFTQNLKDLVSNGRSI